LPANHRFRSSAFFKNSFSGIQEIAKYGLPWSDGFRHIAVTGIPTHVLLSSQMEELKGIYQRVSDGLLNRIVSELDQRTMGGVMSESRFRDLIRAELQAVREEVNLIRGAQEPLREEEDSAANDEPQFRSQIYFTAGKWRRVPVGWQFPLAPCAAIWLSWMCPDVTSRISPMRFFDPIDVTHLDRGRKTISELKWLMAKFEDEAKARELWRENCTPVQANTIYSVIFDVVTHEITCPQLGLLSWQTVYNKLSGNERKKRKEAAEEEATQAGNDDNEDIAL